MSASLRRWSAPFVALLLLFLVGSPAQAQTSLGVNGGLVFSTLTGDDVDDDEADTSTGFNIGANLAIPVSDMISIVPGLYYVQKGTETQVAEGGQVVDLGIDIDYVEIPLLVSVAVSQRESLGVSLFAGPQVAFKVGCNVEGSSGAVNVNVDCDDFDDFFEVSSTDFGAIFGAGVNFPLGTSLRGTVSGGLDLGLTSIDDSGEDNDVKNSAYFLNVGVAIPIGG